MAGNCCSLNWISLSAVRGTFCSCAVRNTLIGRVVADVDLATTAEPEQGMALAEGAGLKTVPVGLAHGTIMVVVNERPFEITTLREDIETYGRHPQASFDAPRAFATDGVLRMETGYSEAVVSDLAARGHEIEPAADPVGGTRTDESGRERTWLGQWAE